MPNETPVHPLPYRILWTWDSWICDPFDAASYVSEYRELIDFAAQWDYNAIIIWGFIDDRHGGEESAREIARYGRQSGVRIMPGVGAGNYCGYVTSPGHRWNLDTFLKEHPDLGAQRRSSPEEVSGHLMCLYRDESLKWIREGAAWLAESFDIGGVNIETNEMGGIDVCPLAEQATRDEPNRLKYAASFSDLALTVPVIYEEIKRVNSDAWVTYATYEPAWWRRQEDAWLLRDMPEDAVAQWNIEMDVNEEDVPAPVRDNVALIHSGGWSYHRTPYPPVWTFTQYRCFYPNLEEAAAFARNHHRSKLQGFALGNVGSPVMPDNEIAYIAHMEFARRPEMTIDEFSREYIAQLYGAEAEPMVKQLVLAQTSVHEGVRDIWREWTCLMLGRRPSSLPIAERSQIERLEDQIALARKARESASRGGKRRLETIVSILDEYRIIAEISADPRVAVYIESMADPNDAQHGRGLTILREAAADLGLPDDMYLYSQLASVV